MQTNPEANELESKEVQEELTVDSLLSDFDASSFDSALAQLDATDKATQEAEEAAKQPRRGGEINEEQVQNVRVDFYKFCKIPV